MSSRSLVPQLHDVCDLLRRCAAALQRDCPGIYRELCLRWQRMEVCFSLVAPAPEAPGLCPENGARVRLRFNEFSVTTESVTADIVPRVETSLGTVLALVEGSLDLHEAVLSDRFRVFAAPDQVVHLAELGRLFVAGALQSQAFVGFLSELRELSEAEVCTLGIVAARPSG